MYNQSIEEFLDSRTGKLLRGRVNLIFTSPPFPLVAKKTYGNEVGAKYIDWLSSLADPLSDLLAPRGSIIIEVGNSWVSGKPVMSTAPLEALLAFAKRGNLEVCQQFICHNPARLPSPASWVTVKRIRLKDSYTHLWWYAKTPNPRSDNRKVLTPYSEAMKRLIKRRSYNTGTRPSDHSINPTSFFTDNGGAIAPSFLDADQIPSGLIYSNTAIDSSYRDWCNKEEIQVHPARMPSDLAAFFIEFLSREGDLVLDPFAGSNTTGFVANQLGRRWVGVEQDPEYVLGSMGRFA